ncbi:MAG: hypothetical protein U0470_07745 [Anaerolineae bacterium]
MDERGDLYIQAADVIYWFENGKSQSSAALYYDDMQALAVASRYGVYASAARLSTQFHGIVRFPWRPREGGGDLVALDRLSPRAVERTGLDHRRPRRTDLVADAWPRVQVFTPDGRGGRPARAAPAGRRHRRGAGRFARRRRARPAASTTPPAGWTRRSSSGRPADGGG